MPDKLEFDDEGSGLVEEFNSSPQAQERRRQIADALAPQLGESILDVGSGPGNQIYEMATIVGDSGQIVGADPEYSAIEIASQRCREFSNVRFEQASLPNLPFEDATFDAVMSSQVFEYLDDVISALAEIRRILRPRDRILIHDTEWGALLWHASDHSRMARFLELWDGHLADPHLPQTLGAKLQDVGFEGIAVRPIVHLESDLVSGSMSDVLMKFVTGYVESQGLSQAETEAWRQDLMQSALQGTYFFSSNEYIFTARKRS